MQIAVYGLWHLGSVVAACLADKGFKVTALDDEYKIVSDLQQAKPPIFEPGLTELITQNLDVNLSFTSDKSELANKEVIIIAFDTPVDENDQADVNFVKDKIISLMPYLQNDALILITSQLPLGTISKLQKIFAKECAEKNISFAYTPENLRLGKAIEVFNNAERIIIGIANERHKSQLNEIFQNFTKKIIWTKIASAEMTKHALNAFLATSISFINEIAVICEHYGADAREVAQALKAEARIGQKAYLNPGGAFAGGTLGRDINFLKDLAAAQKVPASLINGVKQSNDNHHDWLKRKIINLVPQLKGKKIVILGLSYKADSDVLRRSAAVDLAKWLKTQKAEIYAVDPYVKNLPADLEFINLSAELSNSLDAADLLLVMNNNKIFTEIKCEDLVKMRQQIIIDQNQILAEKFNIKGEHQYHTVGVSNETTK